MDDEILKTVESMLGKDIKIVDCEKTSSVREEEVLLINGIPVTLDGSDGDIIKTALMTGEVPPCDVLNQLLFRAGILKQPVHLETSLSVKSSMVRKEEVTVARDGVILNERSCETKEDNFYSSQSQEVWEPVPDNNPKSGRNLNDLKQNLDASTMKSEKMGKRPPRHQQPNPLNPEPDFMSSASSCASTSTSSASALSSTRTTTPQQSSMSFKDTQNQFSQNSLKSSSSGGSGGGGGGGPVQSATLLNGTDVNSRGRCPSSQDDEDFDSGYEKTSRHSTAPGQQQNLSNEADLNQRSINSKSNRFPPNSVSHEYPLDDNTISDQRFNSNFGNISTGINCKLNNFNENSNNSCFSSSSSCNLFAINSQRNNKYPINKLNSANNIINNNRNILSCDSGHDDDLHTTPSQQTFVTQSAASGFSNSNNSMSISSSYDILSSDEADFIKDPSSFTNIHSPTIFGTVASNQCPKDTTNRRGLPQTTAIIGSSSTSVLSNETTESIKHSVGSTGPNDRSYDRQQPQSLLLNADSVQGRVIDNTLASDTDLNALVYRDGNLMSGPLDALIQHMVPTSDYYPDRSYLFAFLLSARLFIRPHELLAKICQLSEEQQNFDNIYKLLSVGNEHHEQIQQQYRHKTDEILRKIRLFSRHFVQLLAEWIDTFPYDFRDERLMQHVRTMTRKCIAIDQSLRKDVSTMLQNLLHRLTTLDKYEGFLQCLANGAYSEQILTSDICDKSNTSSNNTSNCHALTSGISLLSATPSAAPTSATSAPSSHQQQQTGSTSASQVNQSGSSSGSMIGGSGLMNNISTASLPPSSLASQQNSSHLLVSTDKDITELCPNPTQLAQQLTHIELDRLSHIGPEEFVQAFAKENPNLEQSFSDMKKTKNLESYIQWFNRLSYLVATEIVKHSKKKQRVKIVEYWIETARECFNIGNFNSLMAIIAGLNMSPISRLKKTWAKVQSAKFAVLEHQMDPSSNFNSYRSTLKAAMWRSAGATDERERIVIPFFSLLVKDLYFLNEGCSNKLPNGHINFEKFWQLAKQVTEFIAWKQVTCPFEKLPKVVVFLHTNHVLNENTLAMASFECEPPDNNNEKDRYKLLKSEQHQQQQQQQ